MTDKEKLIKVIDKAVKNGFFPHKEHGSVKSWMEGKSIADILFNHDFAKNYWGEKYKCICGQEEKDGVFDFDSDGDEYGNAWTFPVQCFTCGRNDYGDHLPEGKLFKEMWQYHLQQAVVSKNPLDYYFERL